MNIEKKFSKDAENETLYALELYKNKRTGDLEYRTPMGNIVKVADQKGIESLEGLVNSLSATADALDSRITALESAPAPATPTSVTITIGPSTTTYSDGRPGLGAGLNNMGVGIDLLPAPLSGIIDLVNVYAKYTPNNSNYSSTANYLGISFGPLAGYIQKAFITGFSQKVIKVPMVGRIESVFGPQSRATASDGTGGSLTGRGISLITDTGASFTTGDGVLEITIEYFEKYL